MSFGHRRSASPDVREPILRQLALSSSALRNDGWWYREAMSVHRPYVVWVCLATLALPACHRALKASHGDASADGSVEVAVTGDGAEHAPAFDASLSWPDSGLPDLPEASSESAPASLCTGVAQVTVDLLHACAVKADGTMWCWGANGYGQLGDGTFVDRPAPVPVTALGSDVIQAAAGYNFTCALKRDATLWCWGDDRGQLGSGDPSASPSAIPTPVVALGSAVAEVAAGGQHACARKLDGTLWCWGFVYAGDGTASGVYATPTEVSELGSAVAGVSVSWGHICARKTDGSLWCWGNNEAGQLGDGTTNVSLVPIEVAKIGRLVSQVSAGYQDTCATRSDGTLWCWGWRSGSQTPSMVQSFGLDIVAVAVGSAHFCARKRDGTLWCWGGNRAGQLGDGTTVSRSTPGQVTAVGATLDLAVSNGVTCAVQSGGTLRCWGDNDFGQLGIGVTSAQPTPRAVANLGTSVAQLAAGADFFCARRTDGGVACWGIDPASQPGDGSGSIVCQPSPLEVAALARPVTQVAGGDEGSCALSTDGQVWCWGWVSNAAGGFELRAVPFQVPGLPATIVEVAVGSSHACALANDGTLWCWGRNDNGQLGDETNAFFSEAPVQVSTLGPTVAEVATGGTHTCARTADGTLWCWGSNDSGQLGDGTTDDRAIPLPVTSLGAKVRQVSASPWSHTCAVLDDGTAWCWGRNDSAQLGDGTLVSSTVPVPVAGLASVVEVAAGGEHTCARTGDGALWCWGDNSSGQLGTGTSGQGAMAMIPVRVTALGTEVVEVSAGLGATCARAKDGGVWCWGARDFGLMADGTIGFSPSPVGPAGCP